MFNSKVDNVVTRDYNKAVKIKSNRTKYPEHKASPLMLKEAVALPGIGLSIPVRAAKAKLSALLELVAAGQQVTITSDGLPKALLSPVTTKHGRKLFTGMGDYLLKQPIHGGPSAEEMIREDRDSRGW
jgi:prevent-host-death family protein